MNPSQNNTWTGPVSNGSFPNTNVINTQPLTLRNSTHYQNPFEYSFFYNPPDDFRIYHITCKSLDFAPQLLDNNNNSSYNSASHVFYYQLSSDKLYQITCQMISHSAIVQFLNEKVLGIKFKQNVQQPQEHLELTNRQRENLEFNLKLSLFNYLAPKQINGKPSNLNTIKRNVMSYSDADNGTGDFNCLLQNKL